MAGVPIRLGAVWLLRRRPPVSRFRTSLPPVKAILLAATPPRRRAPVVVEPGSVVVSGAALLRICVTLPEASVAS